MQKVNIYSAVGVDGGSTVFFRELTNRLNNTGKYDATFISPHLQSQCKSEVISDRIVIEQPDTVVISHLLPEMSRINSKRSILSCHEQEMGPIESYCKDFDIIHFVSDAQKEWHGVDHPSVVIPPFSEVIKPNKVEGRNIAGVISHIHEHKQIHKAVQAAIEDGREQVLIYGGLGNLNYFLAEIYPLLDGDKVSYKGNGTNKQKMYDSFDALYNYSKSETFSLTISEAISAEKEIVIPTDRPWLGYEREFDKEALLNRYIKLIEGDDNEI